MKQFRNLLKITTLLVLTSCLKPAEDNTKGTIDPLEYAKKYNWVEDSQKTGNGTWVTITKGNVLSWLSQDNQLTHSAFGTYPNSSNIKTNFSYINKPDSVFAINISSDTVYFFDASQNKRADLKGQLLISADTSLILQNTGLTPALSIKYKLQ